MEAKKPNLWQRVTRTRGMGQVVTVTFGLIILMAVFYIINPNFLGARNIPNLLRQVAPYLIIGIGQSYVLITGNIDLSIGSLVGMSGMITATLMVKGVSPWLAIFVSIGTCLLFGFINGVLVANCKLPPFIATLGTMTIARGIAQLVNGGRNTPSIEIAENLSGEAAESFKSVAKSFRDFFYFDKTWVFHSTVLIAIVLWAVFYFILSETKTGRHIYAIGSNIEAAKMSGVSVSKSTITAYLVSSFCASIVGLVIISATGQGDMAAGMSYEMYAVAASVIGGVSTLGGQGILLGTVVGAFVWAALSNGLSLIGVPIALQNIIVGIIVIFSVLSDVLVRRRKR